MVQKVPITLAVTMLVAKTKLSVVYKTEAELGQAIKYVSALTLQLMLF